MTLGEVIRTHRKGRLTQAELAEKMGVSQGTVSKWENEQLEPSFREGLRLLDVLSISIQTVLRTVEPKTQEQYQ